MTGNPGSPWFHYFSCSISSNGYHQGTGKKHLEKQLEELETKFPNKAVGVVKFSTPLAHMITGGADFMLVPSRFEPCGLIQLHAMRYGTVICFFLYPSFILFLHTFRKVSLANPHASSIYPQRGILLLSSSGTYSGIDRRTSRHSAGGHHWLSSWNSI